MIRIMMPLVLIMATWAINGFAQASEEARVGYNTGNKLYMEQKYEESIHAYESVVSQGFTSDDLYASLGSAHLRQGNIGESILALEKALLLNSGNKVAKANLLIAKESIINQVTEIPDFFLVDYWQRIISRLNTSKWIILHLSLLFIALFFLGCKWLEINNTIVEKVKQMRFLNWVIAVLLFVSLLFLVMAISRNDQVRGINYGIVMQEGVSLKDGPDERSNEVTSISEGIRVKVIDQIDMWYKVQLDDKDEGWVEEEVVSLIKL